MHDGKSFATASANPYGLEFALHANTLSSSLQTETMMKLFPDGYSKGLGIQWLRFQRESHDPLVKLPVRD